MKTTVSFSDFCDAFRAYDRQDTYSYEGKQALFEWFKQYEEDCGEEVELDVIAICCDFSEYADPVDCIESVGYDCDLSECEDEEERQYTALEFLEDNTIVITHASGIIIQDF